MTAVLDHDDAPMLDMPPPRPAELFACLPTPARLVDVHRPMPVTDEAAATALSATADLWQEINAARHVDRRLLNFGGKIVTALISRTGSHSLTALAGLVAWDLAGYGSGLYRLDRPTELEVDGYPYRAVTLLAVTGYVRALRIGELVVVVHTPGFKAPRLSLRRGDPWLINRPAFHPPDLQVLERTLVGLRNLDVP